MKTSRIGIPALALAAFATSLIAQEVKPLKVLSIGNSFSGNAHRYLKQIADSMDFPLVLANASIGGCPIQRHWLNASTNGLQYSHNAKKVTLEEFLKADQWNIVTIQQASGFSRFPESYEPEGTQLIEFIRKHAPQAEIVVHKTWSYRQDESRLRNWKITPDQMYADLSKAYGGFAARHGLRVIPAGDAFHLARTTPGWGDYTPADKEAGTPASGRTLQVKDGYHANDSGCYLIGCVWAETLFGKDARTIPFRPDTISPEDAALLRDIAHRAATQAVALPAHIKAP